MVRHPLSALAVVLVLATALTAQTNNEPYRQPQTPAEYWAALKYQISLGRYDLAAKYLQGFLATNPTDQDLLNLERKEGLAGFLELRLIQRWSTDATVNKQAKANVEEAINRVTAAVRKQRTNPARIARFVQNLAGTPEEAAYAENELRLAGAAAMPALMGQFRATQDLQERADILRVTSRMPVSTVPALLATLDMADPTRQAELITMALGNRRDLIALRARPETDPTPALFHLASAANLSPVVRDQAADLLGRILGVSPTRLPTAKVALTQAAEKLWHHQGRFAGDLAAIWRWTGTALVSTPATPTQAEEYYGLRYLRWALETDPAYEPAQSLFLALAVEKGTERGLGKPLAQSAPNVYAIAAAANTEALTAALGRALREHRSAAALGLVQVLSGRNEVGAARPAARHPAVLVQALDYADRRVQLAAAEALIHMPGPPTAEATARVIDVLRRTLLATPEPGAAAPKGKILIGDFDAARGQALANDLRRGGYDSEVFRTGREVIRRLGQAADADAVVLHALLPYPRMPELLASLRQDTRSGLVPIIVLLPTREPNLAQEDRERRLRQITHDDPRIHYVRGLLSPDALTREVGQPGSAPSAPIPEAERKAMALRAIQALRWAALGRAQGYDVMPAQEAIRGALHDDELAPAAIETAARLPLKEAQQDLANLMLATNRKMEFRSAAARALVRSVQHFGPVLTAGQVGLVKQLMAAPQTPAALREQLAAVVGALNPSPTESGGRLLQFQPALPAPPTTQKK